ncbi:MAG: iron export ABC transporter permease subunit FetB [Hyphomicrobiaceae bacterium]
MTYVPLGFTELAIAASLILINALISLVFRLNLERMLLVATLRMVGQLAAVGLVLKLVFDTTSPWVTLAVGLFMAAVAGFEAASRLERPYAGWQAYGLGASTLLVTGLLASLFVTFAVVGPQPWYQPRVLLPILGMVLGNALTGVSLVLDTMSDVAARERGAIEGRLALGATRFEAFEAVIARALRTGLMPIVNAMAAAGVVALPGMMTGQILAGVEPIEAAKYQIMILFVIAGSTALAVIATALGAVFLLTDDRHRLRLDRLTTAG